MTRDGFVSLVSTWRTPKAVLWRKQYEQSFQDFLHSPVCPVAQLAPPTTMLTLYQPPEPPEHEGNAPDFDETRLNFTEDEGQLWISSWDVAEAFGKVHAHVLRDIDRLMKQTPDCRSKFGSTTRLLDNSVGGGQRQTRAYRMTRDGFLLLAFTWHDAKSRKLLIEYMNVFNKMEDALKSKHLEERKHLIEEKQLLEQIVEESSANLKNERMQREALELDAAEIRKQLEINTKELEESTRRLKKTKDDIDAAQHLAETAEHERNEALREANKARDAAKDARRSVESVRRVLDDKAPVVVNDKDWMLQVATGEWSRMCKIYVDYWAFLELSAV